MPRYRFRIRGCGFAVIHKDGTVRAQLVNRIDNPLYYDLIRAFEAISGVPLLLNTSFNDSEPIVCSHRADSALDPPATAFV